MGLAYTLAEVIRCYWHLQQLDEDALQHLARAGLGAAQASSIESVVQYVLGALYEACDSDEEKLNQLLSSLDDE